MCCLKYEQDHYEATRKRMPRVGREVITPDGNGTVQEINVLKETVRVRVPKGDSSETKDYPLEEIKRIGGRQNANNHAEVEEAPEHDEEFIETNTDEKHIQDENASLDD